MKDKGWGHKKRPGGFDKESLREIRYLVFIKDKPCLVNDEMCMGWMEACHVKTRGAGGGLFGNIVPLCTVHHKIQHGGCR